MLRREAEGLILPKLPAFRRGEYEPQDKDERLALLAGMLASCEFEGLRRAVARLYSEAFAAEPKLAEDVLAATRYHAARAAASAGCGRGNDAEALANQHMRWELNDLARRLDSQQRLKAVAERPANAPGGR